MTRINTIQVSHLLDQHLMAEYHELTRISPLARHCDDAPSEYVMGTGHMKFFYNKGTYLLKRLDELYEELKRRGYNVTRIHYTLHPIGLNDDYEPDRKAKLTNLFRLDERLRAKPEFYSYYKQPVKADFYSKRF